MAMHGRVKKDVVQLSPEELEKQREKVRTARGLFGKLLESRRARVYSQQALDMTSKALQFHPEFPTLWGYRRELLESGEAQGDKKQVLQMEMKLLEVSDDRVQELRSHMQALEASAFKLGVDPVDANETLAHVTDATRTWFDEKRKEYFSESENACADREAHELFGKPHVVHRLTPDLAKMPD